METPEQFELLNAELKMRKDNELKSIISVVNRVTGQDITTKSRVRPVADAVKIYSALARKFTPYTFEQIGESINRNYATILHAYKCYDDLFKTDIEFRDFAKSCIETIHNANSVEDTPRDKEVDTIKGLLEICTTEELKKIKRNIYKNYVPSGS